MTPGPHLRCKGIISLQLFSYPDCLFFPLLDRRLPAWEGDLLFLPQIIVGKGIRSGTSDFLETESIELQL